MDRENKANIENNCKETPLRKGLKTIKSFVLRQSNITPGQKRSFENLFPKYGLLLDSGLTSFNSVFGNTNDVVLEIGFGMGDSLLTQAKENNNLNYLGIEVHKPGVGTLLRSVDEQQVENIRVYNDDAIEVLESCIPDKSLSKVQLFFPDPWHKKRHNKRRIVQAKFVSLLLKKLKPSGKLHFATDWEDYALHMLDVLNNEKSLKNVFAENKFANNVDSPATKFEERGKKLGHSIYDLMFELV